MALFTAVLKRVARCARYLAAASRLIVSIAALLAWLLCGSALVVGAHITDAAVDIVLVCLPNGWIGAWLDRRRPWLLALLCAGTCGFAARYIAGHSAGCVCVGPSVCTSFGTTVSELSSANVALMGLGACGLATACVFELLRRFTAVFAEIGPSGVLASLALVAATWGRLRC
jgi:hypothetical protein